MAQPTDVAEGRHCPVAGKPVELLNNPEGVFTSMVRETGEATERFLRAVALGETEIMVQQLNEKASAAMEEVMTVTDPQVRVVVAMRVREADWRDVHGLPATAPRWRCVTLSIGAPPKPLQAAMGDLIGMANVAKSRISRLLGAMAEIEEVESNLGGEVDLHHFLSYSSDILTNYGRLNVNHPVRVNVRN